MPEVSETVFRRSLELANYADVNGEFGGDVIVSIGHVENHDQTRYYATILLRGELAAEFARQYVPGKLMRVTFEELPNEALEVGVQG